jgi:cell division transport system permease protein
MSGRFRLLVSEAWRSLGANISTTVAATLTVLIGMFLLGLFIALGTWTLSWSNHVKQELMVKVYFVHNAPASDVNSLVRQLNQNSLVKTGGVKYTSQNAGFEQMKKQYPQITDEVPSNPLGPRLDVTPAHAEDVDKLYKSIVQGGKPAGVDDVTDGKQISHRILKVAHAIEVVFTAATLVLIAASILLISNTIRLSIFSRRREIEVMKLVGATNWFVRGPFMLEGLFTGLIGALLAVFFLILGKALALPSILPHLSSDPTVHAWPFPEVALVLVAMGLGLGAIGSGVTIRRFLQV